MKLLIIYLAIPFIIIVVGVILLWIFSILGIPKDNDDKVDGEPPESGRTS